MSQGCDIQLLLDETLGHHASIQSETVVSGGCINSARKILLTDGRLFFIKENLAERIKMFETEIIGLQSLDETKVVRVPRPLGSRKLGNSAFLLLEWIEPGKPGPTSSRQLGTMLANLHLHRSKKSFGFETDNFLGSMPQKNAWATNWSDFFIDNRLQPQMAWAREKGFDLTRTGDEKLWANIDERLSVNPDPSLLHGDLWNGNFLIGPGGKPYLIDPAPYWGHHEAEFGILTLFGGFDPDFFHAYRELIPEADGFSDRLKIYQLYHYLNHLNLFGISYLESCNRILQSLV